MTDELTPDDILESPVYRPKDPTPIRAIIADAPLEYEGFHIAEGEVLIVTGDPGAPDAIRVATRDEFDAEYQRQHASRERVPRNDRSQKTVDAPEPDVGTRKVGKEAK
jgi:hypothetical protein